jgi:antitoxin component YwqK of YwqJK toxin-antitoxin module
MYAFLILLIFYPIDLAMGQSENDPYQFLIEQKKKLSHPQATKPPNLNQKDLTAYLRKKTGKEISKSKFSDIEKATQIVANTLVVNLFKTAAINSSPDLPVSNKSLVTQRTQDQSAGIIKSHFNAIHRLPKFETSSWSELRKKKTVTAPFAYFGGSPIHDFCTMDAGKTIPARHGDRISPLDIAMVAASENELDHALLELIRKPDVLARDFFPMDFFEEVSSPVAETSWQRFLEARSSSSSEQSSDNSITDNNIPINANQIAAETIQTFNELDFSTLLTQAKIALSAECLTSNGKWSESLKGRDKYETVLFRCRSSKDHFYELMLYENSEFLEESSLEFLVKNGPVELILSMDSESRPLYPIELSARSSGRHFSDVFLYDSSGQARARIGTSQSFKSFEWNADAQLIAAVETSEKGTTSVTSWWPSGSLKSYSTNGKKQDIMFYWEWHETGSPSRYLSFFQNRPDGLETWWHVSGKKEGEINWYAGKKFGSSRIYFENGVLGFDASYVDDKLDGIVSWRDELGDKVLDGKFSHGLPKGVVRISSRIDRPLAVLNFDHGKADGSIQIGESPRGRGEIRYVAGVLDGTSLFFDHSNRKRLVLPYSSGKLNGSVEGFYADGTPAVSCKFEDGALTSWNRFKSNKITSKIELSGNVLSWARGAAEMKVVDSESNLDATCSAELSSWRKCLWTLQGEKVVFPGEVVLPGRPKPLRICEKMTKWDLSPWIDQSRLLSLIELWLGPTCETAKPYQCSVRLGRNLSPANCLAKKS